MQQHTRQVALIALTLVVVNFLFDWWRRIDFRSQEERIDSALSKLQNAISEQQESILQLLADAHAELTNFQARVKDFSDIAMSAETWARESPSNDGQKGSGELEEVVTVEDQDGALTPLDVSIETALRVISLQRSDDFVRRFHRKVRDPKFWTPADLVKQLQEEFSTPLTEEQSEALELQLDFYRQLAHTAFSQWQAELNLAAAERVVAGDYELPDETTGKYAELSEEQSKDLMTITNVGRKRLLWQRSIHGEIHRRWLVFEYVPVLTLLEARKFLTRG